MSTSISVKWTPEGYLPQLTVHRPFIHSVMPAGEVVPHTAESPEGRPNGRLSTELPSWKRAYWIAKATRSPHTVTKP